MRGLKTLAVGAGIATTVALMSAQAANALASYSATADIQVSAFGGAGYGKGWKPATYVSNSTSSYAIGGQLAAPSENILENEGTTTHSFVPVSSVYNTVYSNTVDRKVISASTTLSGTADAAGGKSEVSTSGTWSIGMYFYNREANSVDAKFTASVSLLLGTSVDDLLSESAYSNATVTALLSINNGTPTVLSQYSISADSENGEGEGENSGPKYVSFTLPGKTDSLTSKAVLTFVVNLDGYATSAVPLPAALPMLGLALGGLGFVARRRSKKTDA